MLEKRLAFSLEQYRKKNGLTKTDFCKLLNLPPSTVYPILLGYGNPNLSTVEYIAGRLEVSPIELFTNFNPDQAQLESIFTSLRCIPSIATLSDEWLWNMAELMQEMFALFAVP